jgi:hypothetical protein
MNNTIKRKLHLDGEMSCQIANPPKNDGDGIKRRAGEERGAHQPSKTSDETARRAASACCEGEGRGEGGGAARAASSAADAAPAAPSRRRHRPRHPHTRCSWPPPPPPARPLAAPSVAPDRSRRLAPSPRRRRSSRLRGAVAASAACVAPQPWSGAFFRVSVGLLFVSHRDWLWRDIP